MEKQAKFVKDNKLNVRTVSLRLCKETHHQKFPVLSDEKGDVRKAYGVGKGLFGLTRAGELLSRMP